MLPTRHSLISHSLLCIFLLLTAAANGQTTPPADTKLGLKAAILLTPEFCATKIHKEYIRKQGGQPLSGEGETFMIGKAACEGLVPPLEGVFSKVVVVPSLSGATASSPGEAQVVLLPRIVDVNATRPFSVGLLVHAKDREMTLVLEWTAKDASGRTVWIETVQGSVKVRNVGNKKVMAQMLDGSVKSAAEQSASKMSASPELRKLTQ